MPFDDSLETRSFEGQCIGPYLVSALIGTGGMGEVYKALDTKLNRQVAIKVLLPALANNPDRLARFSREAQLLASLNHPHIADPWLRDCRRPARLGHQQLPCLGCLSLNGRFDVPPVGVDPSGAASDIVALGNGEAVGVANDSARRHVRDHEPTGQPGQNRAGVGSS
jgi:hypothetical protein